MNQFTIKGMQKVLASAFQASSPSWYMGLCAAVPSDSLVLVDIDEPSIANGYARQAMPLNATAWPTLGTVNNESYIESLLVTFGITGTLDKAVNRLFLTDGVDVLSISSPLYETVQILNTPLSTKYRLYFR
jgi:hypothetical protein